VTKQADAFDKPDTLSMNISAVCISRNPEPFSIRDMPYHNYTGGWKPFGHEISKERVSYLAERRNIAVAETLALFPETRHVLMIDSYYLKQEEQVRKLVEEYAEMISASPQRGCIVGASSWIFDKTRIRPLYRFYDGWTTPEGMSLRLDEVERSGGTIRVKAVGGCYLYPRWVWEKIHYGVPDDLHGCEHNWLCERSGLPVILSLNERLWRQPVIYSMRKRIRMSLHLGRLLDIGPRSRGPSPSM
jgi:hypothetical protein